ncbi:conserved hypothetical protein [Vibrio phage 150E35-1]|nr:conserved hypothetical protein [Vibrio phage 150E35-1]
MILTKKSGVMYFQYNKENSQRYRRLRSSLGSALVQYGADHVPECTGTIVSIIHEYQRKNKTSGISVSLEHMMSDTGLSPIVLNNYHIEEIVAGIDPSYSEYLTDRKDRLKLSNWINRKVLRESYKSKPADYWLLKL